MNETTIPFATADLPVRRSTLTNAQLFTTPDGRRVEVWNIIGETGVAVRFINRTPTGQPTELTFGLHEDSARALLMGLVKCLPWAEPNARGSLPLESLAVELARRLPEMQADSVENNAYLIANLLRQHIA